MQRKVSEVLGSLAKASYLAHIKKTNFQKYFKQNSH